MTHTLYKPGWTAIWILLFVIPARSQSNQVWAEIGTFVKVNDQTRFYFLATTVKESRESTEGEYGPNFDFYFKPLRNPSRWGVFRLDESKSRPLTIRVGYRYIHPYTGESPGEQRGVLEATVRYPLAHGVLVSDRNRMDLRSIRGTFSWRYRNRLTVEKDFSIRRFRFTPYARGEIYYDSRYDKDFLPGVLLPLPGGGTTVTGASAPDQSPSCSSSAERGRL